MGLTAWARCSTFFETALVNLVNRRMLLRRLSGVGPRDDLFVGLQHGVVGLGK